MLCPCSNLDTGLRKYYPQTRSLCKKLAPLSGSDIPKLRRRETYNELTKSIQNKRCSLAPLMFSYAFWVAFPSFLGRFQVFLGFARICKKQMNGAAALDCSRISRTMLVTLKRLMEAISTVALGLMAESSWKWEEDNIANHSKRTIWYSSGLS